MRLVYELEVVEVFERKLKKHVSGSGESAVFTTDSAGWYLRFDNYFSIWVGNDKPDVSVGQKIRMTLHAKP